MNIAVVSYSYGIHISPVVKDMCRYLVAQGFNVDVYTDQLIPDSQFSLPGANIIKPGNPAFLNMLKSVTSMRGNWRRLFYIIKMGLSIWQLKKNIKKYGWIFCVEIMALDMVVKSGWDLSRACYLSLESVQLLTKYNVDFVRELFKQIGFCIIQSPERGKDLEAYLGLKIDFEYLPVSILPRTPRKHASATPPMPTRILYSGYFAKWSQLLEFLDAYSACEVKLRGTLVLQGHYFGTDSYLEQVQFAASNMEGVNVQTDYLVDKEYYEFLDGFEVGLALYKAPDEYPDIRPNWDNLIFSSGKIASYLWAGLAVITNIDSPLSRNPPFLFIETITAENITHVLKEYKTRQNEYRDAALKCADRYYNMEHSMKRIMERIKPALPVN